MKIAHLINNAAHVGGLETYFLRLCAELADAGITQAVVYQSRDNALEIPVSWIPFDANTKSELASFQPDLIHVHNIFDVALLDSLCDEVPMMFTTHGYHLICPAQDFYQEWGRCSCNRTAGLACLAVTLRRKCVSLRPSYLKWMFAFSMWAGRRQQRIAHLVAPCSYAQDRHVAAGFPAERVSLLPYFCDIEPLDAPRDLPERPTLLFLGRVAPYKGPDYFVRVLAALPKEVCGKIVGGANPAARQELEELAQQLGVRERLEFVEWASRDRIAEVFAGATVFVFPSIWHETLGIVGLEAMAHGVPTVAFHMGGARDWLVEGETGYGVPVKDVEAAAEACRKIIDNPELALQMGRKGIARVREHYSVSGHLEKLLEIYSQVSASGEPTKGGRD